MGPRRTGAPPDPGDPDQLGDDLVLWADVCQCEYTDHGHCGPLDAAGRSSTTRPSRGTSATPLAYADAGVDVVAPSGMMDGQVAAIRAGLDDDGHEDGRDRRLRREVRLGVLRPVPRGRRVDHGDGDRAGHQMDPANRREARARTRPRRRRGRRRADGQARAAYLDVIADARAAFDLPLAAYQVSGEYAMLHAAAERGWIDGPRAMREAVTSIRRAGADQVLTYAAIDLARRG